MSDEVEATKPAVAPPPPALTIDGIIAHLNEVGQAGIAGQLSRWVSENPPAPKSTAIVLAEPAPIDEMPTPPVEQPAVQS